ncbi:retinoschisin-like [Patiria miniata]|uniref:F5/8 type C domain-containing protein n=1 Tax=Patiria miniata TaxID=46514 RepID=A0A914B746_PATMI|nr:retinoschisin-like [Patiria miniata]
MARDVGLCFIFMVPIAVLVASDKICFIGLEYDQEYGVQPRWFLPYGDPCKCTAIRLAGLNRYGPMIPSYLQSAPLMLSEDHEEIRSFFGCPDFQSKCLEPFPLGLEDGTIGDQQIQASSTYSAYLPSKARLNNQGSWTPDVNDGCWIEVDLGEVTMVSGVITQGSNANPDYRVTAYQVMYLKSSESTTHEHVMDNNGNIKIFIGNLDDANTPITSRFDEVVMATKLRIVPIEWFSVGPGLRFELLGCRM